ncbi:cyclase family protein [Schleiferiaceae bacterium]|nr:cyclase family protein [Schleiferiaceae bacterium]
MRIEKLHYSLNSDSPTYGLRKKLQLRKTTTSNQSIIINETSALFETLHIGTHIDFPLHFVVHGKTYSDYSSDHWFVESCALYDTKKEGRILKIVHDTITNISAEILFINTKDSKNRYAKSFAQENSGLNLIDVLDICERMPSLRFIALDNISISRCGDSKEGSQIHQFLLERDILIIEDLNIEPLLNLGLPDKVIISPLPLEGVDGVPISIYAIYENIK